MTNSYPRETDEPMEFTVRLDGTPLTTGVEVAVVPDGTRPTTWVAPLEFDGALHVRIYQLAPGAWRIFARPTAIAGRKPVIDCGAFLIT